jgi:hypothetical protein
MLNRITIHHTGGSHTPNETDLRAYHRVVDGDGRVHNGDFDIEANDPRYITEGRYAAHTLNLNSGNIGVSLACMGGADWADPKDTRWFPTQVQVESALQLVAELCSKYNIAVSRQHVLTHAEVQTTLGVRQKNKWDFDYDPFGKIGSRDPLVIGDMLRSKIKGGVKDAPVQVQPKKPTMRQGAMGAYVHLVQKRLKLKQDGMFGPETDQAVRNFQARNGLLPDGVVGPMTWFLLER